MIPESMKRKIEEAKEIIEGTDDLDTLNVIAGSFEIGNIYHSKE
jgi:hypothetical protein